MGLCFSYTKYKLGKATRENTSELTYEFKIAKVIHVHDGDTFQIAALHLGKMAKFTIRLYGVDTPELHSDDDKAEIAKQYVKDRIEGKIIHIDVLSNRRIRDKSNRGRLIKCKYGRLLANVYIGKSSLAQELIDNGLGKPYFG